MLQRIIQVIHKGVDIILRSHLKILKISALLYGINDQWIMNKKEVCVGFDFSYCLSRQGVIDKMRRILRQM